MLSDWFLAIEADPGDLAYIQMAAASSPSIALTDHGNQHRLSSVELASVTDDEEAWQVAQRVATELAEVAGAVAGKRLQWAPGVLGRMQPNGNYDQWIHVPTLTIHAVPLPPAVMGGSSPGETRLQKLMRLQSANDRVRLAMHFLNLKRDWINLWKVFEIIRDGSGGEKRLVELGWATRDYLRRFRHTADNFHAVGDAARHADLKHPPPSDPMRLPEADIFIRGLFDSWIQSLP